MDVIDPLLRELCESTPLVDTHEHLIEESARTSGELGFFHPCDDWAYLFLHYTADDLAVAGLTPEDRTRFFAPDTPQDQKIRIFLPVWERTRHTGYAQAVRRTARTLYGETDFTAASIPRIDERYRALVRPGFYRTILRDHANLVHCQVNSLEKIFFETADPALMPQDISFVALSQPDFDAVRRDLGESADTLDGWCDLIDRVFARVGPRAVAAKNQAAYMRRLNYAPVDAAVAAPIFARRVRGEAVSPEEAEALQNHLTRRCIAAATAQGLPVKLHTGYYAGHANMPLARVKENAADLAPLLRDFPDTRFVLMHLGWPYQDEFLALAKHYPNVWIDMCWAWIINPAAGVRFVREFLVTAPANKLLPFGGDYATVECVVGHAQIARQGIAQALSELVSGGWIAGDEAALLVPALFHGNARALFPHLPGIWDSIDQNP